MKNDLLSCLRLFIKNNGKNTLDDIKILGSFIYTNTDAKYTHECEVLMICIKLDYHKKLLYVSEQERASVKKDIVECLNNNEGLDLNICNITVDILEAALFEIEIPIENEKFETGMTQPEKYKNDENKQDKEEQLVTENESENQEEEKDEQRRRETEYIMHKNEDEETKRHQREQGQRKLGKLTIVVIIIGIITIIIYGIYNSKSGNSEARGTPSVSPKPPVQTPNNPEIDSTIPSVTRVTIHGSNLSIERGQTHDFSAEVIGTNNPNQSVTWSINETGRKSGTNINSTSGRLTIDPNETLSSFTVTATSTFDKSKSGLIVVTVTQPPPPANPLIGTTWEFINQNDNGNRYRLSYSNNNNVTLAIYNSEGSRILESYNGKYTLQGNMLTMEFVYPEGKMTNNYTYSHSSIVDNKNWAIIYKQR